MGIYAIIYYIDLILKERTSNMKHISLIAQSAIICLVASNAYASHFYTNAISAHNIASFQHTIAQTAFSSFDGPMSRAIFKKAGLKKHQFEDPATTYGHAPMYGTMSIYGEYNDDGRSGGDNINARQTISNAWISWQHVGNDTEFDEITRINSEYDIYMGGLTSGKTKIGKSHTAWGIYTGYLNSNSNANDQFETDSQGGFFGIYNRFQNKRLNVSATINGGVIDNSTDISFGTDETTNFWVGGLVNTTYNIIMDNTFTLQPNIQFGYTWIKSENYTSASNDVIKNNAYNMFELTPGISAIKHIGNNWFGEINVKHVMIFANDGDITVNGVAYETLNDHDFTEYSLSLEKAVGPIAFRANIGRRDGGHSGWMGGLNFKYLF